MPKTWFFGALCALMLFSTQAALAEDKLDSLIQKEWNFTLQQQPFAATSEGVRGYNHLVPDVSPAALKRRYQGYQSLLNDARQFNEADYHGQDRINLMLLKWRLEEQLASYELGEYRIPLNTFYSFFLAGTQALDGIALRQEKDYEDYLARMEKLPDYFEQHLANMRQGLKDGFTQPKIVMQGVLPTVKAQIYANPEDSPLYAPFAALPGRFSNTRRQGWQARAKSIIANKLNPAFARIAGFFENEYIPATRSALAATALPNGKAFYQQQIKNYVTVSDVTAEDIHRIGLNEVARIKAEMKALIAELEFDGSLADFIQFLRTDQQFYASTAEDLLKEAAYTAKRIDIKMPSMFGKLPRLPYGVEPVPAEIAPNYTTAAYWNAPIGSDKGGAYVVNTYALDQRPLYELTALTLHEGVPGHHHQIALAQELTDVADFRRNLYFSAFGEGWALYAEKLGVEMGVYRSPYEHFGRLSYEMWRACRLVIDTGIHAKGWTRQQGLDYLASNTSLSLANVRAEVDRYISWPGQALSYKMGELKIWELRRKAEASLGDKFDIRAFHDAILANGAVPLAVLEAQIDAYIQGNKG